MKDGGISPGGRIIVSVHDVAPATSAAVRRWVADLDARQVPASLLVIPGPWQGRALLADPGLVSWLNECAARGHEIALHGFAHSGGGGSAWRQVVDRIATRGCGEFWTADEAAALILLRRGRAVLAEAGFTVTGFTPPGWLASAGARRALRRLGFRYTTSHLAVHDLAAGTSRWMPALSHRPGAAGERLGAWLMPSAAERLARAGRGVRIALHPADLEYPGLREAALRAIESALAAGATATTYDALLDAAPRA